MKAKKGMTNFPKPPPPKFVKYPENIFGSVETPLIQCFLALHAKKLLTIEV